MKDKFKKIGTYFLTIILGILIGILLNIPSCSKLENKIEYIPVHDTITVNQERIVEHTKIKYVTLLDTFYLIEDNNKIDTVWIKDLPIEYKEYNDTIKNDSSDARLNIKYHGFNSDIDSISLIYNYYNKKETIIQKPKKVGLDVFVGPYIGYGAGFSINNNGAFSHGPNIGIAIGIGLGYRIK